MMKRSISNFVSIAAMSLAVGLCAQTVPPTAPAAGPPKPGMKVTSPAFEDGGILPNKYTIAAAPAQPVSPPLAWTNAPAGTVSFAVITFDMDSWPGHRVDFVVHWLMFNIPGTSTAVAEALPAQAQLPDGSTQAMSSHNSVGWAIPRMGAEGPYHHYAFQLYALDTKLALGPDASLADVQAAMQGHVLSKSVVVARFHKP